MLSLARLTGLTYGVDRLGDSELVVCIVCGCTLLLMDPSLIFYSIVFVTLVVSILTLSSHGTVNALSFHPNYLISFLVLTSLLNY